MENLREKYNIELPRARGAYLEEAPDKIWTEEGWVIECKEDGTRESLQIGAYESLMVGRNREGFLKGVEQAGPFMVHPHPVFSKVACEDLCGTILDGECTMHFTKDGSLDETSLVRLKQGSYVGYTVWEALFFRGQDIRTYSDAYRRQKAREAIEILNHPNIRLIERFPATKEKMYEIWNRGEEGCIAKNELASLKVGQRTCTTWWKLKASFTADAFITGVQEGKSGGSGVKGVKRMPDGTAASFTVSMFSADRKKVFKVANVKYLPDEVILDGYKLFNEKYKGKVVEMRVSGWNGKFFRWARFVKFRDDKTPRDCIFEEQIGKKG